MTLTLIATPDPEPRPATFWNGAAGSTGTSSMTFTWSNTGQPATDQDPWLIVVRPLNPPGE